MTQMLIDTFGYMSPMYITIILGIGFAFLQAIVWAVPEKCYRQIGIPRWIFYTCNVLCVLFVGMLATTQGGDCDPFASLGTFGKAFMAAVKSGSSGSGGFKKELAEWILGASVYIWSTKATLELFGKTKKIASVINVVGIAILLINAFCIYQGVGADAFAGAIVEGFTAMIG